MFMPQLSIGYQVVPQNFFIQRNGVFFSNAALSFHAGVLFQQNNTSFSLVSVCKDGNETNKQFGVGLESRMCIMFQMQMHFPPVTFLSGEEKSWGKRNGNLPIAK